jgi:hypothetical protein
MIKYLMISALAFTTILSGCSKKTDALFPETADQRLEKSLKAFQASLMGSPGWKLFVYPQGLVSQNIEVGGLTYYVSFADSNRVTMVSDFNIPMATVPKESGYRLKATQRPSLIFDTYSYIHVAADPDESVSFSPAQSGGFGWGTDFDFSFTTAAPTDTLNLKGNFNQSDAYMIRATQQEMDEAFNGQLAHIVQVTSDFASSNPFLYFKSVDNAKIGISFNLFLYRVNFTYLNGGELVTINAPFSHTTYGVHFKNPITVGGYTFQDAYWDESLQVYYIKVGAGRVDITNSDTPLFPFNVVLGKSITTISVPTTPLAGQSALFGSVYNDIKTNLKFSGYNLDLMVMDFIFDDQSKTMALIVNVEQTGTPYQLIYVYSYSLNSSSMTSFNRTATNGNGSLVEQDMLPLLNYIDNDVFKMDYFTGTSPLLGQFTSQNNPGFYFTGNLQ